MQPKRGAEEAPQIYLGGKMFAEFFIIGFLVSCCLLAFGWYALVAAKDNKGNLFLVAGALLLIIVSLFVVVDGEGLEIRTGECVNQTLSSIDASNITMTNYTYGPCYVDTTDFGFTEAISVMLILVGIGTLLGVVGWSQYANNFKNI